MAIRVLTIKKSEKVNNKPFIEIDCVEWIDEKIEIKGSSRENKLCSWIRSEQGDAYLLDENCQKIYLEKQLKYDSLAI
jgi:hypothetical protein